MSVSENPWADLSVRNCWLGIGSGVPTPPVCVRVIDIDRLPAVYVVTEKLRGQNEHADVGQRTDIDKLLYTVIYVPLVYCFCH